MNSFTSLLFLGILSISRAQSELPTLIESKVDGKVLTITNKTVPPTGPYERLGVTALKIDNTSALPQYWTFNNFEDKVGQIGPANGGSYWNSLTALLPCDDCFAYFYTYDYGQTVSDGSRLLRRVDSDKCVKNPGEGEFITEVPCNENDVSQLWIVNPKSIKSPKYDYIEDESTSSEGEFEMTESKGFDSSEEEETEIAFDAYAGLSSGSSEEADILY